MPQASLEWFCERIVAATLSRSASLTISQRCGFYRSRTSRGDNEREQQTKICSLRFCSAGVKYLSR